MLQQVAARLRACVREGDTVARLGGDEFVVVMQDLAMQAAQKIFNYAGGRALFLDSPMQRQFRDCFAASAHHSLSWDSAAMEYGKYQLQAHQPH